MYLLCLYSLELLSDAELGEDAGEDFVGGDEAAAGDGTEGGGDGPDFLGEEVGGERIERREGLLQGPGSLREGLEMPAVGDDGVALEKRPGVDALAQSQAKVVDAGPAAGRDADGTLGQHERGAGVDLVDDGQQGLLPA